MHRKMWSTVILTLILILGFCAMVYNDNVIRNEITTLQIENYNQTQEIEYLKTEVTKIGMKNNRLSISLKELQTLKQNELVLEEQQLKEKEIAKKSNPLLWFSVAGVVMKNAVRSVIPVF